MNDIISKHADREQQWDSTSYRVGIDSEDSKLLTLNLYYDSVYVDTIMEHYDIDALTQFKDILNQIVVQNNLEHKAKDEENSLTIHLLKERVEDLKAEREAMSEEDVLHETMYRR